MFLFDPDHSCFEAHACTKSRQYLQVEILHHDAFPSGSAHRFCTEDNACLTQLKSVMKDQKEQSRSLAPGRDSRIVLEGAFPLAPVEIVP